MHFNSFSMIDLISDTVTKPTPEMLAAMFAAPVGDDIFDEDPSVNALQEKVAAMFGMEAALFCASGTMTNQIALNVHTRPGDEVICHHFAHIYHYESGGMMANSGLSPKFVGFPDGLMVASQVEAAVNNPNSIYLAKTRLVEVENTSNKGGGTVYNLADLKAIEEVAKKHNLSYHLDGARLFNALAVTGESTLDYGKTFDSLSICLSKGLGCPVGSVLVGKRDFIREAKRIRKRFGGAWRQAGYLAAAGIYALDHHISRLPEDHVKAQKLGACLAAQKYVQQVNPVQTNIVIFTLHDETKEKEFAATLLNKDVRIISMGQGKLRMVTHMDVSMADIDRVCEILAEIKL
jgi:threonine aldolase